MPRWFYALLVFVPAAVVARLVGAPDLAVFALSAFGLAPVAGLMGRATEALAHHLGPRLGGLLSATFGNAAELIITTFAVHRGLLTLVEASITGSIIGNTLLVLGASLLTGGLRHGVQRFDPRQTSLSSAMMILAIAGLYMPATLATTVRDWPILEELSLLVAGVLILTYVAYLLYSTLGDRESEREAAAKPDRAGEVSDEVGRVWSRGHAFAVLAGATVAAAVASETLVDAVEPVTRQLGWSEFFMGVIIVPLVGNVAENFSAVQMAWRDRLDATIAIAAGSSTQVALFVAPVLVFLSALLGHPMDLIFLPLELVILGLATAIFAYISLDGKSNWLEGVQLLALYLIAAVAFFFLPTPPGE